MNANKFKRDIVATLQHAGCTVQAVERPAKHLRVRALLPSGAPYTFTISCSPRDFVHRLQTIAQDVRRLDEQLGVPCLTP